MSLQWLQVISEFGERRRGKKGKQEGRDKHRKGEGRSKAGMKELSILFKCYYITG